MKQIEENRITREAANELEKLTKAKEEILFYGRTGENVERKYNALQSMVRCINPDSYLKSLADKYAKDATRCKNVIDTYRDNQNLFTNKELQEIGRTDITVARALGLQIANALSDAADECGRIQYEENFLSVSDDYGKELLRKSLTELREGIDAFEVIAGNVDWGSLYASEMTEQAVSDFKYMFNVCFDNSDIHDATLRYGTEDEYGSDYEQHLSTGRYSEWFKYDIKQFAMITESVDNLKQTMDANKEYYYQEADYGISEGIAYVLDIASQKYGKPIDWDREEEYRYSLNRNNQDHDDHNNEHECDDDIEL